MERTPGSENTADCSSPDLDANSLSTAPGMPHVTLTPERRSSAPAPATNERRKALLAA